MSIINRIICIFIKLKNSWMNFWFGQSDGKIISISRIILGLHCIIMLLSYFPNLRRFFSTEGIHHIPILMHHKDLGFYPFSFLYLQYIEFFEYWIVWIIWFIGIISALCFALGFYSRLFNFLLLISFASFANFSFLIRNAEDGITIMFLFFMLCGNASLHYSLDSRRFLPNQNNISTYSQRLIQISMLILYFFIGLDKLLSPVWQNGEALYWILANKPWSDFAHLSLFRYEIFYRLASWATIIIELFAPIALLFKKTRLIAFISLICLHIGIIIFMGKFVMMFNIVSLAGLICFWPFQSKSSSTGIKQDN